MSEDNLRKYKKHLITIFLSTSDPLTYEELNEKMKDFSAPENFLKRMLVSLERNNMICAEPHNGKTTYILTHLGRRRFTVISKRNKIRERRRKQKILIGVFSLILVVVFLVWCICLVGGNGGNIENGENEQLPNLKVSLEDSFDAIKEHLVRGIGTISVNPENLSYEVLDMQKEAISDGYLVLVNSSNKYERTPENLVSIFENKIKELTVSSESLKIRSDVMDKLNAMITEYNSATGRNDIRVTSAYRSSADQQQIYDETLNQYGTGYTEANVQKAGFSDSQSGYAVAFSEYSGGETSSIAKTYAGEWLSQNAFKYGFILRFPEGKNDLTGFAYRASNYRYVGVPHATYISENNLCLEEYIELLKTTYRYGSNHLEIKCADGTFGVYYVEGTSVSVPRNTEYTVSGNNSDGFIITYLISGSE